MLLSIRRQLTLDNKFLKTVTSKGLSSNLEVLSLSKIGYIYWRMCGLSYDVDVDFEELEGVFLRIAGADTLLFTSQFIVSKTSTEIELSKTRFN